MLQPPADSLGANHSIMTTFNLSAPYVEALDAQSLDRLATYFYRHARLDPLLAQLFANVPGDHLKHVADFISDVLADLYERGETQDWDPHLLARHLGCYVTLAQRRRWMDLLLESADAVGLPQYPAFRSALGDYLEWGSRLALRDSLMC